MVKGAVLAMLADTQAAHFLGGFKVGVGFALRRCRNCLATKDTMSTKVFEVVLTLSHIEYLLNLQFMESDFALRTPANYDYHCSLLEGPLAAADSVTYGVNYESVLNKLEYFHVCNNQLPQDIMHILLEGVIPYNLKAMLISYVYVKGYISIQTINQRILSFNFSWSESKSKPCPLSANMLRDEGRINQTGSQLAYIIHL